MEQFTADDRDPLDRHVAAIDNGERKSGEDARVRRMDTMARQIAELRAAGPRENQTSTEHESIVADKEAKLEELVNAYAHGETYENRGTGADRVNSEDDEQGVVTVGTKQKGDALDSNNDIKSSRAKKKEDVTQRTRGSNSKRDLPKTTVSPLAVPFAKADREEQARRINAAYGKTASGKDSAEVLTPEQIAEYDKSIGDSIDKAAVTNGYSYNNSPVFVDEQGLEEANPGGKSHPEAEDQSLEFAQLDQNESEENKEWEPINVEIGFIEQGKMIRSDDGTERPREKSEDCVLIDEEHGIFGVFDGMGGMGGDPTAAAMAARDAIYKTIINAEYPHTTEELTELMQKAMTAGRDNVERNGEGGHTVGTFARLARIDDKLFMAIAQAGDTRLLYRGQNKERIIATEDQSEGNIVSNSFSKKSHHTPDLHILLEVSPNDRFVLCSDGITGDWAHQFLSEEQYVEAFEKSTPQEVAETLLALSKKNDDKSAVVVDIK